MNYVAREWIIQRLGSGPECWVDFNTTKQPREQMEPEVERLSVRFPAEEFRGHNIRFCDCHATALKGATRRLGDPRVCC